MISLSKEERIRVATYLEQEAASDELLIEQMSKGSATMQYLGVERQKQVAAYRLVARQLFSIETETIR